MTTEPTNVRHVIAFIPIADQVRQVVSVSRTNENDASTGTHLSLHVRSRNPGWPNVSTQLTDGRQLSDMIGGLTVHGVEAGELEGRDNVCGVIVYDAQLDDGPLEYFVFLTLRENQFNRVLELARSRSLSGIETYIDVPVAIGETDSVPGNVPGMHSRRLGLGRYHVWDPTKTLKIQTANFNFDLDRAPDFHAPILSVTPWEEPQVKRISARAHRTLARVLLNYPQGKWIGEGVQFGVQPSKLESPTAGEIEAVAQTAAGRVIGRLIAETYQQGGAPAGYTAATCAVKFIEASGVIYRARERQEVSAKRQKMTTSAPIVFPSYLAFWWSPRLDFQILSEENSLEAIDRGMLLEVCSRFYKSGVRCIWFEKMLVEALVGAETYATIKASKTNPSLWTGRHQVIRTLIAGWAFSKSKGGASYLSYITLGNWLLEVLKVAIFGFIAWKIYLDYDRTHDWPSAIGLMVIGLIAIAWTGRYLTRLIVRWSKASPTAIGQEILSSPLGRALSALLEAYKAVTAVEMSTTAARAALLHAIGNGGAIDHIALAYLDRAIDAREFIWTGTEAALGAFEELDDEEDAAPPSLA